DRPPFELRADMSGDGEQCRGALIVELEEMQRLAIVDRRAGECALERSARAPIDAAELPRGNLNLGRTLHSRRARAVNAVSERSAPLIRTPSDASQGSPNRGSGTFRVPCSAFPGPRVGDGERGTQNAERGTRNTS